MQRDEDRHQRHAPYLWREVEPASLWTDAFPADHPWKVAAHDTALTSMAADDTTDGQNDVVCRHLSGADVVCRHCRGGQLPQERAEPCFHAAGERFQSP